MTPVRLFQIWALAVALLVSTTSTLAGETRRLTLAEAVQLAVQQNRGLKISRLKVKENEYKKDAARSDYFPTITNQSNALHITELQALTVPQGAFGTVSGCEHQSAAGQTNALFERHDDRPAVDATVADPSGKPGRSR